MKARTKGSELFLITNLATCTCKEYSKITFVPAENQMIETVQPANIPH